MSLSGHRTEQVTPCRIHITTDPSRIIYVNGVLDSYEGIGIMRTADEHAGKIIIYTTQHDEATVKELLAAMEAEEGLKITITSVDYEDEVG